MLEKGRIVSQPPVEVEAEVSRHKCCWVALMSLCLLTVNIIVCMHLARRLAYVEGQLAKQCVSTSEETSIEEKLGDRADVEMSHGVKSKVLPTRGSLYNNSPREFEQQNRKRRSETKALHGIEDAKLVYLERHISSDHTTELGNHYTSVTVSGDVMIKVGGRWFPVCLWGFWAEEADVACKHLGGQIWHYISSTDNGHNETLWSPVVFCWGDERNLGECRIVAANASCEEGHSVRLSCKAHVGLRLSDGQKPNEGRVELPSLGVSESVFYIFGFWESVNVYSICKKGWGIHASNVLCRQLGYKRVVPISVDFDPGSGTIYPYNIQCIGNESNILECQHSPLEECDDGDVVGVVCDGDDCNPNPCQNKGTCTDGVGHYICQCARGWVGVHCQKKENLSSMERTSHDWAHIKAASDSKGDTDTVKRHETVLTKHWEQFPPSEKFRFNSGVLTVLEEGDYYVYSQVYYRYSNKRQKSISHSVMVVKDDKDNPYCFLTCWKYMEEPTPLKTCFTAGVIHLSPNNSVYLHMPCDGCSINLDHDATFFGIIKLPNTKSQHHSLVHGENPSSDKVEDEPPTVVHPVKSTTSTFEKMMRDNFLTILKELPNGYKYRITSGGRIKLKRN